MPKTRESSNRYKAIIERVFKTHFQPGQKSFEFERKEFETVAAALNIVLPKNLGDLVYTFRYREDLPKSVTSAAPKGYEWVIESAGRSRYRFSLASINRIVPNGSLAAIKIPDATPAIISDYAQSDEQALLAKLRYNRMIDIFLGVTAYSPAESSANDRQGNGADRDR